MYRADRLNHLAQIGWDPCGPPAKQYSMRTQMLPWFLIWLGHHAALASLMQRPRRWMHRRGPSSAGTRPRAEARTRTEANNTSPTACKVITRPRSASLPYPQPKQRDMLQPGIALRHRPLEDLLQHVLRQAGWLDAHWVCSRKDAAV